ncbi:hypothetical protein SAMN03159463_02323 [Mesorhizobium sp. NFR06]|uniref:hypothetical protein n=1 Tax=Mesorhizobium sp. NFR06 TaxID=1566290 RepID=UPI0008F043DC|nr:hypothetical protein [Mesorhizobium sp. NFR06]SFO57506.1 hypothetical protein SAMN03159463_02323 [Mesorhizobium sp. NFR06]
MQGQIASHSRSVWANLDAIVIEEVEALHRATPRGAEAPTPEEEVPFRSDDEFMRRATAYLGGRGGEAYRLIEHLRDVLGLDRAGDAAVGPQESAEDGPGGEAGLSAAEPPEIESGQEK